MGCFGKIQATRNFTSGADSRRRTWRQNCVRPDLYRGGFFPWAGAAAVRQSDPPRKDLIHFMLTGSRSSEPDGATTSKAYFRSEQKKYSVDPGQGSNIVA
jgi:hypothetical protein